MMMPEVQVSIPNGLEVAFHPQQAFVRAMTALERMQHVPPDTQGEDWYAVVDSDGGILGLVAGGSKLAFAIAKEKGLFPVWMQ